MQNFPAASAWVLNDEHTKLRCFKMQPNLVNPNNAEQL